MNDQLSQAVFGLTAKQVTVEPTSISRHTHFVNDLGFDSLDTADYVMRIEEEFGVSIADADVAGLQTVGDVIDYLAARGASSRSPVAHGD